MNSNLQRPPALFIYSEAGGEAVGEFFDQRLGGSGPVRKTLLAPIGALWRVCRSKSLVVLAPGNPAGVANQIKYLTVLFVYLLPRTHIWETHGKLDVVARSLAHYPPRVLNPISSAMLVRDSRTSWANGAFGRHDRQDSAGIEPNCPGLFAEPLRCRRYLE